PSSTLFRSIAMMGVAGRLADTHDSRLLLSAGIGVQVLALVVLAWSPGFVATLAGVLLLELGQAVIGPVWTALLPRVVGEEHVGAAIAWQQGLGAVAAPGRRRAQAHRGRRRPVAEPAAAGVGTVRGRGRAAPARGRAAARVPDLPGRERDPQRGRRALLRDPRLRRRRRGDDL